MWKNKKRLIIIAAVLVLVIVATTAGIAFAQTPPSDTPGNTLFARVAKILGIDQQKVEDAFSQAQREIRDENLDTYLQKLVDEGKMTQAQADEYKTWWQSRPDTPQLGPNGGFGGRCFPGGGMMRGFGGGRLGPNTSWGPQAPPQQGA